MAIHKLKEIHTATHPARLPPARAADRAAAHARQTAEAALAGAIVRTKIVGIEGQRTL